jgi:hypothetical protein
MNKKAARILSYRNLRPTSTVGRDPTADDMEMLLGNFEMAIFPENYYQYRLLKRLL